MYCIAVYDVAIKRNPKTLKVMRRYLTWKQRSVFEGELTEKQLEGLIREVRRYVEEEEGDSLIIYILPDESYVVKKQLGKREEGPSNFL
ncbi:MAG: CRISPR-associated endonuclease Cas2 [Bacteroidota bacterium]|nr:CRISPR-associated endonuclease Cas2 [Bacteroidota bacterium]